MKPVTFIFSGRGRLLLLLPTLFGLLLWPLPAAMLFAAGITIPAANEKTLTPPPPQVAVLLPLTGAFAALGAELKAGFELGFSWLDAADLKPACTIDYLDTESDPETAGKLIALVAAEGRCLLAAGTPLNPCAFRASRTAEENELPYLIVGADQENLIGDRSRYSFRLTRPRSARLRLLRDFIAAQQPEIRTLAIIYDDNPCAVRNARRIRRLCGSGGLDLAIWEKYREKGKNFYDLLNMLKKRQPDLLLLIAAPENSYHLWRQGTRLEVLPATSIILDSGCFPNPQTPLPPPTAKYRLLRPLFLPRNPDHPAAGLPPSHLQALAFAAAEVICRALGNNTETAVGMPAVIVGQLEKLRLETVCGPVTFSGPGRGHQNRIVRKLVAGNAEGGRVTIFPATAAKTHSRRQTD